MSQNDIRVLIVDDHPLVSEGIQSCISSVDHLRVVGVAENATKALELVTECRPDVILMDINMPDLNGLDLINHIKELLPSAKILVLSMHESKEYIVTALNRGAKGYVLKDVTTNEIITAIKAIHVGGTYFSSGVSEQLLKEEEQNKIQKLTPRERDVLLALGEGKSNKEIARDFELSVRTVETHRKNIKRKLGIMSTAGLTRYIIENDLSNIAKK